MPEASDRKRKVRPGRRGDAYGQLVPGILGAEDGYVEDFEAGEIAGMGGTEMEAAWLKWKNMKQKDHIWKLARNGLELGRLDDIPFV